MKKSNFFSPIPLLLSVLLTCLLPVLHAQEEGEAETGEAASQTITQGRAAVLLANSLGLYVGQLGNLTPQVAAQLLAEQGIAPVGGWAITEPLNTATLARILGQSLGIDSEFTDEQKNDPDAQAYRDALLADFDLDVDNLPSLSLPPLTNTEGNDPTAPEQTDVGEPEVLVNVSDFEAALAAIVPSAGGDGGQVDDGASDITPSAP